MAKNNKSFLFSMPEARYKKNRKKKELQDGSKAMIIMIENIKNLAET